MSGRWSFWIDRGGTFTDIVARRPDGLLVTRKLLSSAPGRYEDAALQGIRDLLELPADAPIPADRVDSVKMGTTVATNALLERKGAPTLLAITAGFGDALRIGYQARPRLFDRHIVLPEMLYARVAEIDERVGADGTIHLQLDEATVREALRSAFDAGFRAVAIVLMHGYRHPGHEQAVARLAEEIGFTQISTSHGTMPVMKLVARGDTTVADAYLSPVLRRYVDSLATALGPIPLMFMQSNGGLTEAARFHGKDAILSGPAGGMVGAVRSAAEAGSARIVSFDMGGTSTDIGHFAGTLERAHETEIAGVRLTTPMLQISTIAAGGGSICRFDGGRLRVGPESAGADPGPACYGRGGPLTVTDCNLLLGRIQPAHFPALFGASGRERLDVEAARLRLQAVADETGQAPQALAAGFLDVAVDKMAHAIKKISVGRGYDVRRYALACFGGAGGQHACRIADRLGMERVLIHPMAGVLSAYGIGLADLRTVRRRALELPLGSAEIAGHVEVAAEAARAEIAAQGIGADRLAVERRLLVKYAGADTPITVPYDDHARASFEAAHRQQFGFLMEDRPMIVAGIEVEAIGTVAEPVAAMAEATVSAEATAADTIGMRVGDAIAAVPLYRREVLQPGQMLDGPALIAEANATTVVEPGWRARFDAARTLVLTRTMPATQATLSTAADPATLELFNNLFMAIAEQMGSRLQLTAHSVNIKERLDFSCALFDAAATLIANAPHMPVHLGSMGDSVAYIIASRGAARDGRGMRPGDVYALNDPYHGGTHLPDVTVVAPVFVESASDPVFYVAARGHQADIGGLTPGSMPPLSRTIEEEGVLIDDFLLVDEGRFREQALVALLKSGRYPARNTAQNVADLRAQIAACRLGETELLKAIEQFGLKVVQAYAAHVLDHAEAAVRRVIERLEPGRFSYALDQGTAICVSVEIDRPARRAIVDFAGTSAQQPDNFNAPASVAKAAVLYVFRTLVDDDIPLNGGCLRPLDIRIPAGSMLNPEPPAAVVAGNVETSQVVTDALYGALGIMAAAQGTMNNFTFGNDRYQYYETICGGSGAGPDFDGTDAVHTNMTNSRLTDPEVLEWRFPVLLESFSIRRGSGGRGAYSGGSGVTRRVRCLEPMKAAILANRRKVPPYGMRGGEAGAAGGNRVERGNGRVEQLSATAETEMAAGDVFVIETPGGGGFGRA